VTGIALAGPRPKAQPSRVPALREELSLHPGPRSPDGAPSWTLQDPASNRFYRIGWAEFEMLSRWDLGEAGAIARAVTRDTTLEVSAEQVAGFVRFLAASNLIQVQGDAGISALVRQAEARRKHGAAWLLKNYLFFRLPLVRPDRFLAATKPLVAWVFTPVFLALVLASALAGGWLVLRRWDGFLNSFMYFFSLEGAALAALALGVSKLLHEMGHAYAANRFGCRVPTMGVAFLVMWPVLYTDTSDAWKLPSRRRRLAIGAAGMAAELTLAAFATLAWSFLPDGPLRSACFLLATSTWILTLAVNLNPFMRFDGYYLLADWLDIPNLQDRSFALARWWLRERLFGFGDPRPERFRPHIERLLIAYAFATWIYRFFLFLGIALLVYHMFFKMLGIFLFAVEIAWFILRPIRNELEAWAKRRQEMRLNRQTVSSLALAAGLVALTVIPWRSAVPAGALFRAEQQATIYSEQPARLAEILVRPGDRVAAGQVLFRLDSPDLQHQLAQGRREVEVLDWQAQFQSLNADLASRSPVVWRELQQSRAKLSGLVEDQARLTVPAPFAGMAVEVADPLSPGDWLQADMPLAYLIDPASGLIEAYVEEAELGRISVGASGRFQADDPSLPPIEAVVERIDDASARLLPEPALASIHGGSVASRQGKDGVLIPELPVYRVLLRPVEPLPAPPRVIRGEILIEGERESFASRLWRNAVGVLVRESGF
jgi:putative peptide zinc metalloprotease protein